jgi:hypothetical protein
MVMLNPIAAFARTIGRIQADRVTQRTADGLAPITGIPVLKPFPLPTGRHGSINIGWQQNGASLYIDPASAIRDGYDGVVITGAGPEQTEVYCTSHDGQTIAIKRGPWVVRFENMKIVAGFRLAMMIGEQNLERRIEPKFQCHLVNVHGLVLSPEQLNHRDSTTGKLARTKWWALAYNADRFYLNCVFDATQAAEHVDYNHGHAKSGSLAINCRWIGSGAQLWKIRSDATETAWAGPSVVIAFRDCEFENWHQPHTDRGGAACVGEGSAAHWSFERCVLRGGYRLEGHDGFPAIEANARALCVALSSEGNSYDMDSGRVGVGFGNGWLIMRQCATWGDSEVPWNNKAVYVGRNGGSQQAAKGVLIEQSGLWGRNLQVQISQVPAGRTTIRGCNTLQLRAYAENVLLFPQPLVEVKIATAQRLVPLSEGIVR